MKAAIAVAVVAVVSVVSLMVFTILRSRDTTFDTVRECAQDAGARSIGGTDRLGPLRVDLLAGTLLPAGAFGLRGGNRATFLRPDDGSYLVAVVSRGDESGLELIRAVRVAPERLPVVAWAPRAAAEGLRGCVELRRGRG